MIMLYGFDEWICQLQTCIINRIPVGYKTAVLGLIGNTLLFNICF